MEELRGGPSPSAGDIILIAKQHMADPTPYKVTVLLSEARANALRAGFMQPPAGCPPRRLIAQQVQSNLQTVAPKCAAQGIISAEAKAYLLGWCAGDWPRKPRPRAYPHLENRCEVPFEQPACTPQWNAPARLKHVDLAIDADNQDNDLDCEDDQMGAIVLDM